MIDFDKLCNEFCTGMDLYKTITKLHHMDIKYHVVNTDNTFCFMIPIIDGIAEIIIKNPTKKYILLFVFTGEIVDKKNVRILAYKMLGLSSKIRIRARII